MYEYNLNADVGDTIKEIKLNSNKNMTTKQNIDQINSIIIENKAKSNYIICNNDLEEEEVSFPKNLYNKYSLKEDSSQ